MLGCHSRRNALEFSTTLIIYTLYIGLNIHFFELKKVYFVMNSSFHWIYFKRIERKRAPIFEAKWISIGWDIRIYLLSPLFFLCRHGWTFFNYNGLLSTKNLNSKQRIHKTSHKIYIKIFIILIYSLLKIFFAGVKFFFTPTWKKRCIKNGETRFVKFK